MPDFSIEKLIHSGAFGFMIDGGIFMWPILFLGILALAVIIERWRSLKILDKSAAEIRNEVVDLISQDRVQDALDLCDNARGPIAAIMGNGLRKYHVLSQLNFEPARIEDQVNRSMEAYGTHVVAALERHLPILATVSSVAPMIGFLGTVQGMVISFGDIVAMKSGNIVEAAAAGIMTALLTTCLGLIVGIPAFTAFNYYMSVINQFVLEVESSAARLLEAVSLQLTLKG